MWTQMFEYDKSWDYQQLSTLFKAFLVDYKSEYVMLPIESNRSVFPK